MEVNLVAMSIPQVAGCHTMAHFIAYCARVSNPANQANHTTSLKLLQYLVKNDHWSPFEMVSMTLEIKTTRDIARQILRHRSFSFQEFSQRYAEQVADPVLREVRMQDAKNRQNSTEIDDPALAEWWATRQQVVNDTAQGVYKIALAKGIAKEVARAVLPEGNTASTLYMAGTIRSWIHYCQLRTANGTQREHMEVADAAQQILYTQIPDLKYALEFE